MSMSPPAYERIARLFLTRLNLEVPSPETDLFDAGVLDSMAFVELLVRLEEEFGIEVPFDSLEIDNFRSIEHIARFVEERALCAVPPKSRAGG